MGLVKRWLRRHKAIVATAAVSFVFVVIGLISVNVMLWKEKSRTNENFKLALSALDALHGYLSEEGLNTNPEQAESILESLRADLALYSRLAGQNPVNQEARWGAARAYRRMADIQSRSAAKLDEAEADYAVADRLLEQLQTQSPTSIRFRDERAQVMGHWGRLVYLAGGRRVFRGSLQAEKPLLRSLEIDRKLIAEHPSERRVSAKICTKCLLLDRRLLRRRAG